MTPVQTARGPIDVDDLGTTLMHEHVFVLTPEIQANHDLEWDEETRIADAVKRLEALKDAGIDSLVDLTVIGLGRYVPRIERIAEQTRLNILVATGLYTYRDVPLWVHFRGLFSGDPVTLLADMFVRDIEEGIPGTDVHAAVLKCATDEHGVTEGVETVLRAAARAHRRTGVPISTHTHAPSEQGLAQQRIFEEEGVELSRVVIGHSGDSTDVDYLERLIEGGSYLGMDRFGVDLLLPFEERVAIVATMCERGHADKMVLSHDAACHMDWFPDDLLAAGAPNWHFLHITNDVIPALKERGVTDEQIHTMLVDNPRRIFSTTGAY
ncbi:MAG TPA: phosphotriesterase-related protein [Acidimicrobiia bacterium]|nr:phosphotriesterase-related protein [Acidimicrobiia bacterium]